MNLTQAGAVHVYDWSAIQDQPMYTVYGDRSYSRFGNNIMVSIVTVMRAVSFSCDCFSYKRSQVIPE